MSTVDEKPYCTCKRGPKDGFSRNENGDYVHECGKPTKLVYEKIVLPKMLVGGKNHDEILRRREIFELRVNDRQWREYQEIAKELNIDVRVVQMIWETSG